MTAMMSPASNFDRLAGIYRWMEVLSFGLWLWRCRCNFLEEMKSAKRALVLGDGDGRFTARLLRENPQVQVVDTIDASPAMMAALLRRAGEHASRVHARVADVRMWSPMEEEEPPQYDLVVTHFFLDCLTTGEVERLAARVKPLLADDATWVVSEFAIPAGRFGRLVAAPVVGSLYVAFRWMTGLRVGKLPNHTWALERAGFRLLRRRNWLRGLLVSERWGGSDFTEEPIL